MAEVPVAGVPLPAADQVGAIMRVFADGCMPPHAVANEPSAAKLTAPPMKRRRDQRCAVVSVTICGISTGGRSGSPAVGTVLPDNAVLPDNTGRRLLP